METLEKEEIVYISYPPVKVLVVDDREDNLLSMETILEPGGYIIRKANSGRAALKILLKEQDFALILMDVQMPDLTGFETATMIYERDILKHIPIIFITANDYGEDSIFKGYEMGGVDYISKPINPELLKAKVSVFIDLYNKNRQLIARDIQLIEANKRLEEEIDERKASEETIRQLNRQLMDNIRQLEITNEELQRFAYVASHDLQEPLRKIVIFGNLLAKKYCSFLTEEGQDFIGRMVKASERMQMLINNLLAFSKSASNIEVFEETDLNILLTETLNDLEIHIKQKNAALNIGELPTLKVIPSQFRRLFQNLITNALKFNKEGASPEINISAEKVKGSEIEDISSDMRDEDYYKIYIKDNGIGFEQKYEKQIFIIFKRLHTFDHIEGTGIGLSICKKIIEQHNGTIFATGELNKGATFTICVPVKQHPVPSDN